LKPEARNQLYAWVGDLYKLRSGLFHSGDADQVTDDDIKRIERVVGACLRVVLTDPTFVRMRETKELDAWFHDRLLEARRVVPRRLRRTKPS
jgi:hypothetical protein